MTLGKSLGVDFDEKAFKVTIKRSEAGNHTAQTFVERTNRTLGAERLFTLKYAQEMISEGRSTKWVKSLQAVLKAINSELIRITGKAVKHISHLKP